MCENMKKFAIFLGVFGVLFFIGLYTVPAYAVESECVCSWSLNCSVTAQTDTGSTETPPPPVAITWEENFVFDRAFYRNVLY